MGNGQVSLSDGRSGFIMVFHNNRWNTVCDDGFDHRDAQVVCRQLFGTSPRHADQWNEGFYNTTSWSTPHFLDRSSTSSIVWSSLGCSGSEYSLQQCGKVNYPDNCNHSEDAWVVCN